MVCICCHVSSKKLDYLNLFDSQVLSLSRVYDPKLMNLLSNVIVLREASDIIEWCNWVRSHPLCSRLMDFWAALSKLNDILGRFVRHFRPIQVLCWALVNVSFGYTSSLFPFFVSSKGIDMYKECCCQISVRFKVS